MRVLFTSLIVALSAILIIGCIMPTTNIAVAPGTDLRSIRQICVYKFQDGGHVAHSGDIATRALEAELMRQGFKLIPISQIKKVISIEYGEREGMSIEAGMLTPEVLQRIRQQTGADAILIGSVSDAWVDPMYIPSCWFEMQFQLINTKNGELIVTGSTSNDGWSLQSAAQQAAAKAIKELKK